MTKTKLKNITGGLSWPSKMPGPAWSLPTWACKTGEKLSKVPGSVCEKCYAKRGRMMFKGVQIAQERRLECSKQPGWKEAMVEEISKEWPRYFRWFDSGDLQSHEMMADIVWIAQQLPHIQFWLPTQEREFVHPYTEYDLLPKNLTVRISAAMIDGNIGKAFEHNSVVADKRDYSDAHYCPATGKDRQQTTCGNCRACWDKNVKLIVYRKH